MKTAGKWIGIVLTILMMFSLQALAQNGKSNSGVYGTEEGGFGNGECQNIRSRVRMRIISDGVPVTISGTVFEALYEGNGLTVDTGTEQVTIYGLGPQFYWDELSISKPDVGEEVIIDALELTFSDGNVRIIATTVTIEDVVVSLRDEDGRPLWRRSPKAADEEL